MPGMQDMPNVSIAAGSNGGQTLNRSTRTMTNWTLCWVPTPLTIVHAGLRLENAMDAEGDEEGRRRLP